MSLMKRFYEMLVGKASAAVDAAADPEEKVRLALHEIEESADDVRAAMAGPVATARTAERKYKDAEAKVADLEAKVQAAIDANNQEVARIRGGQLLDARRLRDERKADLDDANAKANEARDAYARWKRKSEEVQAKAMESLDTVQRAEAQEKFNQAMQAIDSTAGDSAITQAMEAIEDRAARADAEASLDADPEEEKLRQFEKDNREADVADLLKEFQPAADEATTAG